MPKLHKIEGFILKKKVLLEKDVMVTLFSKEHGKLTVMAKGARTFTSRRAPHLQTGNLIKAQLSEFHNTFFLQSTELISGFLQLRTDVYIDYIYLYLGVIDALLPENQPEERLYETTKRFFVQLAKGGEALDILHTTLQTTLDTLGYVDESHSLSELITIVEENTGRKLPRHVIIS